jgi:hypothetical protein
MLKSRLVFLDCLEAAARAGCQLTWTLLDRSSIKYLVCSLAGDPGRLKSSLEFARRITAAKRSVRDFCAHPMLSYQTIQIMQVSCGRGSVDSRVARVASLPELESR